MTRWAYRTGMVSLALLWTLGSLQAADIGEIAIVEDSDGTILPAGGFCSNFAYPRGLCLPPAGQAFYQNHPDEYDVLIFTTSKVLNSMYDSKACAPLKADIGGIGWDSTPWTYPQLGSGGRLFAAVVLGSLSTMPDDPQGIFHYPPIRGVEVVGHEIAHRWLAYVKVDHDDGNGPRDILRGSLDETSPGNHWSCWFNTGGSIQYGAILTDNGDGTFTDRPGPRRFSPLDQYLMGLRDPEDVGPMYYVRVGYSLNGCGDLPGPYNSESTFEGERIDFTIDDIIRANGPRTPERSPCHLKVGFVLVHPTGEPPNQTDIDKMEAYRAALEVWWDEASDGRGSLDTSLTGCGGGSDSCKGAPSPHCKIDTDGDQDFILEFDQEPDALPEEEESLPPDDSEPEGPSTDGDADASEGGEWSEKGDAEPADEDTPDAPPFGEVDGSGTDGDSEEVARKNHGGCGQTEAAGIWLGIGLLGFALRRGRGVARRG